MKHLDLLTYWKILVYKFNSKIDMGMDHDVVVDLVQNSEYYVKDDSYCITICDGVAVELIARNGEIIKTTEVLTELVTNG